MLLDFGYYVLLFFFLYKKNLDVYVYFKGNYNFFNIIEGKFINMNKIYKIIFDLFRIDYIFFCKVMVKGKFLLNY